MRFTRWRFAEVSTVAAVPLFFVLLVVLGYGYLVSVVSTAIFSLVYFLFSCAIWGMFYDPNSSWIPWLVVAIVIAVEWGFCRHGHPGQQHRGWYPPLGAFFPLWLS